MTDTNNRRQQQSDERRQRVLAVATEVFLQAGFQAARVDDIAERAGVSKGLVYVFFENKRGLFEQVLKQELLAWTEEVRRSSTTPDDPLGELQRNFISIFSVLERKPMLQRILGGDQTELGRYLPVMQRLNLRWRRKVAQLLQAAVKQGQCRRGLDIARTVDIIDAIHRSYLMRAFRESHDQHFSECSFDAQYVDLLGDFIVQAVRDHSGSGL